MKIVFFLLFLLPALIFAQGKLEVTQDNNNKSAQANPPKMIKVETADGIRLIDNPDYTTNDNAINEENNTIVLPNEPIKNEENNSPEIKSELNSTL